MGLRQYLQCMLHFMLMASGVALLIVAGSLNTNAEPLQLIAIDNPFYTNNQDSSQIRTITGKVIDDRKEPIIGAIVLVRQNGVVKGGGASDEEGIFRTKPLPSGIYEVEVRYESYKTNIMQQVTIADGKTTEANFCMEIDPNRPNRQFYEGYRIPIIDPYQK